MLFYEYALTPHIFSKEYCGDDVGLQKDLIAFLKGLRENSMVANINKEQWQHEVKKYLASLPLPLKDKLSQILQELKRHNRIVVHESIYNEHLSNEEKDWLELIIREDEIAPYASILFTGKTEKQNPKNQIIEELLDSSEWEGRACNYVIRQTKENLIKYLTHFLMYARKLIIIDPYFTYNRTDKEALMLYADLFAKRRGKRLQNKKIIIHTSYNTKDKFVDIDSEEYKASWVNTFRKIYNEYGHIVTLKVWKDNNRIKILHDRHMITDQSGIHSGRGFNIIDSESTWSLLGYEARRSSLNMFEDNYPSNLELIFELDKEYDIPEYNENHGVVKKLIQDNDRGKAGFIASPEGKDLYFQMPTTFYLCSKIEVGTKVEFVIGKNDRGEIAKVIKVITD